MPISNGSCAPSTYQLIPLRQVVHLAGCHPNTIRKWSNEGILPAVRVGKHGHRRWNLSEVMEFLGLDNDEIFAREKCHVMAYARVSTAGQAKGFNNNNGENENSLTRQIDKLKDYSQKNYGIEPAIYSDIGSGLSYTRKQFNKLLGQILSGQYNGSTLLLTHKDRLARFGVEVIETICNAFSVEVIYTEQDGESSNEQELAEDLLSIIHVFSSRHYGSRGAKASIKHLQPETIQRAKELFDYGLSVVKISDRLNQEGHQTSCGSPISAYLVKKFTQNEKLDVLFPATTRNSIDDFIDDCLEVASSNTRIAISDVFDSYLVYCQNRGKEAITMARFGSIIKHRFRSLYVSNKKKNQKGRGLAGVIIKNQKKHWIVEAKGTAGVSKATNVTSPEEGFRRFYKEQLQGKFKDYRKALDRTYFDWCDKNELEPIKINRMPSLLRELGNHFPKRNKHGCLYDFTE